MDTWSVCHVSVMEQLFEEKTTQAVSSENHHKKLRAKRIEQA